MKSVLVRWMLLDVLLRRTMERVSWWKIGTWRLQRSPVGPLLRNMNASLEENGRLCICGIDKDSKSTACFLAQRIKFFSNKSEALIYRPFSAENWGNWAKKKIVLCIWFQSSPYRLSGRCIWFCNQFLKNNAKEATELSSCSQAFYKGRPF